MPSGTGLEAAAADQWIFSTLSGDATLVSLLQAAYGGENPPSPEFYSDAMPPDVIYPYVIWQLQTPVGDLMVTDGITVWSTMDFLVRVIDRGQSYATITPIYGRIHQLLHRASGSVALGVVGECLRLRPLKMPSIDDAIQYRILGGVYRLRVQA